MRYLSRLIGVNLITGALSWGLDFSVTPTLLLGIGATLLLLGYEGKRP